MELVVDGFIKDGEIYLAEDINIKSAKVKIIFMEDTGEDSKINNDYLLKSKLKINRKNFKFNREEIYNLGQPGNCHSNRE